MKRLFLIFALCALSFSAAAQKETGVFFGVGAGMNFGFDGLTYDDRPTSHNGAGWAVDAYVGGWLNPTLGLRGGWQGFSISDRYTDFGNRRYNYVHGDLLIRAHRNVIPYVHGGYVRIVNSSIGGGAGVVFPIHLGKHVMIIPDIKLNVYPSRAFGVYERNLAATVSATVGVAFRFGGKKKPVVAEQRAVAPVMPVVEVVHDTVVVKETVRDTVIIREQVQPVELERISALAMFDSNKADLRPDALPELDKVAEWFASHPEAEADIEGHTDNTASANYNQTLSERRAKAVREYLISKGISPDRLSYAGYGYSRPVAPNDTPEGRQKNRRVEIKVR